MVYDAVAHWAWAAWVSEDGVTHFGWMRAMGMLDFAGGQNSVLSTKNINAPTLCVFILLFAGILIIFLQAVP